MDEQMIEQRFWIILREPNCVPERKGSWPLRDTKAILREFMKERPTASITIVTIHDGKPDVQDGGECLMMLDGRMVPTAMKHIESCRAAERAAHSAIAGKVAELTWQPIETAPRDGSHVLLWTDTHCGDALSFAELVGIDRTECAQIGAWDEDHWHTEYIGEPTHWMKLPDAPAALAPYPERRSE